MSIQSSSFENICWAQKFWAQQMNFIYSDLNTMITMMSIESSSFPSGATGVVVVYDVKAAQKWLKSYSVRFLTP